MASRWNMDLQRKRARIAMKKLSRFSIAAAGLWALAAVVASMALGTPGALARVSFGINLGWPAVAVPPVVVGPPMVVAPPVVIGPPAYYVPPPVYYYGPPPAYGVFWYDRWGHRHWRP
jgi:hypothetical protein